MNELNKLTLLKKLATAPATQLDPDVAKQCAEFHGDEAECDALLASIYDPANLFVASSFVRQLVNPEFTKSWSFGTPIPPYTLQDVYDTIEASGNGTTHGEPESIEIHTPINKEEGWFGKLVWHHHDGDIDDARFTSQTLQGLINDIMTNLQHRYHQPESPE